MLVPFYLSPPGYAAPVLTLGVSQINTLDVTGDEDNWV